MATPRARVPQTDVAVNPFDVFEVRGTSICRRIYHKPDPAHEFGRYEYQPVAAAANQTAAIRIKRELMRRVREVSFI